MKRYFYFLLMAVLVCCLSLSVTSCSKDDDNNNGGEEQETYEGLSTLENDQLADLVAAWTDAERDDLNGTAWLNNQYEPTIGLELDETQPGIRSIVASTVEGADSIAASMLSTLGIDYEKPAGFKYNNSQVGTIEYSHGEGNTLGTISVKIRQIPVLQEIRLVKELGENAKAKKPYYKCGDRLASSPSTTRTLTPRASSHGKVWAMTPFTTTIWLRPRCWATGFRTWCATALCGTAWSKG